jgi:hypothetical protein
VGDEANSQDVTAAVKTWFRRDAVGNAGDSRAAAMANAILSAAFIYIADMSQDDDVPDAGKSRHWFAYKCWRRRRIGEGQDGARMDYTRHGTLSLFAALDAVAIFTCTYT